MPERRTAFRYKASLKEGGKKAYVYLKKGDKIEIA
jgi:ribosomal protein L23